jgi:hypothetical protein
VNKAHRLYVLRNEMGLIPDKEGNGDGEDSKNPDACLDCLIRDIRALTVL